jgi:hypothetical protein
LRPVLKSIAARVDPQSRSLLYFRTHLTVATAIFVAYGSGFHFEC